MGASDLRGVANDAFSAYYKQQLGLTDQEWSALEACLRSPLPVTWRFSGNDERAISLRASMEQNLLPLLNEQPTSLPWYPDRLGWQFGVSRAWLRGKDRPGEGPEGLEAAAAAAPRSTSIKAFHAWLLRESSLGNLQRQEAVSMVPPLLLDVRPGMAVLDMCASPGSKAQQILEMLAAPARIANTDAAARAPVRSLDEARGLLVANDADVKRCQLLASRAARLHSPSLVVTSHDARLFPEAVGEGAAAAPLLFDRVLCDVPCSGDGTLRKNPVIWRRWTAGAGNMLHSLQVEIGCKGVRLLKVGGRLVYSTCSLNPVENEAVVARILTTFGGGCLRLVGARDALRGLACRPGMSGWKVWHRGQWHGDWASVQDRFRRKCPNLESLFPPGGDGLADLHLDRCLRLMPHDANQGGFFVAVFEKTAPHPEGAGALPAGAAEVCVTEGAAVLPASLSTNLQGAAAHSAHSAHSADSADSPPPAEPLAASAQPAAAEPAAGATALEYDDAADAQGGAAAADGLTEAPPPAPASSLLRAVLHAHGGATHAAAAAAAKTSYAPLYTPSDTLLDGLRAFFGLDRSSAESEPPSPAADAAPFPAHRLVARSPTGRSLLLVSGEVLSLLRADTRGALRIVNTGVRLFEAQEAKGTGCAYRVCQDGLPHLLPHIRRQRAPCSVETVALLLSRPPLSALELGETDPALAARLKASCQPGSVVLEATTAQGQQIRIVALYAPSGSLGAMVKGLEKEALTFRLTSEAGT